MGWVTVVDDFTIGWPGQSRGRVVQGREEDIYNDSEHLSL